MRRSKAGDEAQGPEIRDQESGAKSLQPDCLQPESLTMCLHQFIRPGESVGIGNGSGDCRVCAFDPVNNRACANYRPLKISVMDIEGRNS